MKKSLLTLGLTALTLGANAQINEDETGAFLDFRDASTNCWINSISSGSGTNGVMNGDGQGDQTSWVSKNNLTVNGLEMNSNVAADFAATANPLFFQLPFYNDNGTPDNDLDDDCEMKAINIDAANSQIQVTASASVAGAELQIFLGKSSGQYGVESGTHNTDPNGAAEGILASYTFTSTDEVTFTIDLTDESFDVSENVTAQSLWDAWAGKADVDCYAFRSNTAGANFVILDIAIGSEVTSLDREAVAYGFEAYPNPSSEVVNFNYSVNGSSTVELSNSLGAFVSSTDGNAINVSELAAGLYFATLKVNGEAKAVQRVQVQ